VAGTISVFFSGSDGGFGVAGELAKVGDVFEVDFLSVGIAFDFNAFLLEAFGFGGVLSVSLISPSSRLSSASEVVVFVRDVAVFAIADGGAAVEGVDVDSSSP
jgi:hypothetical protein